SVMKMGTERILRVLDAMGHPQNRIPVIHVAGTNGKGSVCAMLESVYRAAGYRTGLFISPHLVTVRERIQIAGQPLDEAAFVEEANRVVGAMATVWPNRADWLTYFEFVN